MTKETLIKRMEKINRYSNNDIEGVHVVADELLLRYINDPDIKKAYEAIPKWYA